MYNNFQLYRTWAAKISFRFWDYRRKARTQTSDKMNKWSSRGQKSHRRERARRKGDRRRERENIRQRTERVCRKNQSSCAKKVVCTSLKQTRHVLSDHLEDEMSTAWRQWIMQMSKSEPMVCCILKSLAFSKLDGKCGTFEKICKDAFRRRYKRHLHQTFRIGKFCVTRAALRMIGTTFSIL